MEWKRGCSLVLAVVLMLNAVQWPEMKGWAAEPDREAGTVAGMPAARATQSEAEQAARENEAEWERPIWRRSESAVFLSGIPGQIPEGSWRWTGNRFGI